MIHAWRELKLPGDLCQAAEDKFIGNGFADLEELVQFLLRELLRDEVQQMDAEEDKIVEQRLRDLGYI